MNTTNFCKRKGLKGSYLIVQLHSNSTNRADIMEVNMYESSCYLRGKVQSLLQFNMRKCQMAFSERTVHRKTQFSPQKTKQ